MDRQKVGMYLFWFGVVSILVFLSLTVIQSQVHRVHTADELVGTLHEVWGPLFWVRIISGGGLTFALVGVLLYTGKKGSKFWLLGFLPNFINFGQYWEPSQHMPALFGIGGTVILFSYFGILWLWTRTYQAYDGAARTGRFIQLLGISILITAALLVCMVYGNPKQLALADLAIPSGESINLTLALGMFVLFVGYFLSAKAERESLSNPI